ncbi:MAG: mechanosensitive ion channel domain-containing protein [Gammaproteobacteria bacterium]
MFYFLALSKRITTIGLLIALASFPNGAAAEIPLVPDAKSVTAAPKQKPLNPAALAADWWRGIDVPDERGQRIGRAIADLRNYFADLPPERKTDIEPVLQRTIANLEVYAGTVSNKPPAPVIRQPFADSYTLKEWLEVSRKLASAEAEIESDRDDIVRTEKRIAAMRKRFDTMTAAYLERPETAADKALSGLELIGYWAGIVTLEARQKAHKEGLAALEDTSSYLSDELKAVDGKIRVDEKTLKRLDKEVKRAKESLDKAHDESIRLEGRGFVSDNGSELAKVENRLLEQQQMNAGINESLQMLILIRLRNLRDIAQLLAFPEQNSRLDKIRDELRQRRRDVQAVADNFAQWRETSNREQGLAGEALAAMTDSTGAGSEKLKKIQTSRLELAHKTLLLLQRIDDELHDAAVTSKRLNRELVKARGMWWDWSERSGTALAAVFETGSDWLAQSLFKIGDTPVTALGLLRVVLIITLALWLSKLIRRGLNRLRDSGKVANTAFLYTLGRVLHYVLITLGVVVGLSSIGVDFTNLALIAGALGVGMGFGLQTIVSNFVSGLIVLFERSLRVGDFVELDSGLTGEVKEINVRSTLVTTNDNVDVLVPNSEFIGSKVINWTLTDAVRRIHVPFGVAYGSDKDLVRKAVLEAAENVPWSLKHPRKDRVPQVWLVGFGDSSLDFELVVWISPEAVKRPNSVQAAYLWEIETALSKYHIEIPFPQRDLHLRSGFERIGSGG